MVRQRDGCFRFSRWVGIIILNCVRTFYQVLIILALLLAAFGLVEEEEVREIFGDNPWIIIWILIILLMLSVGEAVFGCVSAYTLNYTMMYTYAIIATTLLAVTVLIGMIDIEKYSGDILIRAAVVICSWVVVFGLRDDPNGGQPVYGQQY